MEEGEKITFFLSCLHCRFDEKENVSNCIQLKTSVIKGIKNQLLDQFPDIDPWLNQIMPKKDPVKIVRWYVVLVTHSIHLHTSLHNIKFYFMPWT